MSCLSGSILDHVFLFSGMYFIAVLISGTPCYAVTSPSRLPFVVPYHATSLMKHISAVSLSSPSLLLT